MLCIKVIRRMTMMMMMMMIIIIIIIIIISAATYHSKEQPSSCCVLCRPAKFNISPISETFNCGHHITVYVNVPTLFTLMVFEQSVG